MVDERPGSERLVAFTDAVVAIAITLLVLPLVDEFAVPTGKGTQADLWHQLGAHHDQLFAFVLSFALIARQWWWHHQVFRGIERIGTPVVLLDLTWTFTIVALPLPTVIVAAWRTSGLAFGLYAGTLLVSAICLTALVALEYRRPVEAAGSRSRRRRGLVASVATTVCFALVLVVGLLASPGWGYACYWLLVLTGPLEALIDRRRSVRERSASAPE